MRTEPDPFEQLRDAAARFVSLAATIPSAALERPTGAHDRTVATTLDHVAEQFALTAGLEVDASTGAASPGPDDLPGLVEAIVERYEPLVGDLGPGIYGAPAYVVGETIVHGDEIARAIGDSAWAPSHDDVIVTWRHGIGLMQGFLRPEAADAEETWEVRFAGEPGRFGFRIHEGTVDADVDAPSATRYVLEVDDAVAFHLVFPLQRREPRSAEERLVASRFERP